MSTSRCYVCGKNPAKNCTRCHSIAYCNTICQKKDWTFHKHSCRKNPTNIIDQIIQNGVFDHLVKKIFMYLSGKELHAVRCVKRSWRDIINSMWRSKVDRRLLENKLEYQWTLNEPRGRMVFEAPGIPAQKIVLKNDELFVGCHRENDLFVLAMDDMYKVTYIPRWQTKVKHTIPKPSCRFLNGNIWDVHDKFVIVLGEQAKIKCWDRVALKEMIIYDKSGLLQVTLTWFLLKNSVTTTMLRISISIWGGVKIRLKFLEICLKLRKIGGFKRGGLREKDWEIWKSREIMGKSTGNLKGINLKKN